MPKKLVKWGVKVWCLCDSHTGYCLAFSVYTGTSPDEAANLDLVVMRLVRHHLLSYHHLYGQLFHIGPHGRRPAACGHLSVWDDACDESF